MPHDHSHNSGPGRLSPHEASRLTGHATRASVAVATILVVFKGVVWWQTGSVALLASAADSLLDLTASLIVFLSVRYAASPADEDHRYGHGKAEAFAGLIQAMLVAISAVLLLREGISALISPDGIEQGGLALGVMALSIALTLVLLFIQTRTIEETGSIAIEGDRAHYFTDLGSNVAAIIGIAGAAFAGLLWLDGAAAIAISLWLGWTAWEVGRGAYDQLMDRELPDEERERIETIARDDPRILGIHQLRTRAAGPLIHIQFHMELAPDMTLADAHHVVATCENRLLEVYPAADIIIHPDPKGVAEPHGAAFFTGEDGDTHTT